MSVKVMGLVWDAQIERGMKFILLAYADHADHEGGNIYPAIETIARKTGYDERSVQRLTSNLEQAGYLVLEGDSNRAGGVGKSTRWRIPVKGDKLAPIPKGDKIRVERVTKKTLKGDKVSPDPSLTIIKKTSRASAPPVKTQAILDLEYLEKLFAETRGVPMPDWEFDPRAAQKLWRTPLKSILTQCHSLEEAEEVVIATIEHMRADKLTFTKPVQILESALSLKADRRNGKQNGDREYVEIY